LPKPHSLWVLSEFDKELLASNLVKATTLEQLYNKEKILTSAKMIALNAMPIVGQLDYQHLKDIHRFLFEDVYSWAGQDRYEANITATFGKGTTHFTPYDKLPLVSAALFDALKDEAYFKGQTLDTFIKSAASFMNGLNILHPFREGNGRTQRVFMEYVSQNAGYVLNFCDITAYEMIKASIVGAQGNIYLMEEIFRKSLINKGKSS
jgi:cell filamentation protein